MEVLAIWRHPVNPMLGELLTACAGTTPDAGCRGVSGG